MLLRITLLAVPVALGAASSIEAMEAVPIDPEKSEIRFVSRQMGVPIEGRFGKLSGTVRFDADKPENARADIQVDLGSVDAGSDDATTELKRKSWFNVAVFPAARFVATGAMRIGPNQYRARGELAIKGITHTLAVPFTVKRVGDSTLFEGGFTLPRRDFNIGEGMWADAETVANEVEVRFRFSVPERE